MPLDPVAERYAQTLYLARLEEISKKYSTRTAEVAAALAGRGIYAHNAGHFHSEMARIGIERIGELTDARVDALLNAYKQAEMPIDNSAVTAINQAAAEVFEIQGGYLVANIREQASRYKFPPDAVQSMAGTIEAAMSHIRSRINYKLSALRDEAILAAQSESRREITTPRIEIRESVAGPDAHRWTRGEKWTAAGVIVAAIALVAIFFVPEVRVWLHLEKRAPNPSALPLTDGSKSQAPVQPKPDPVPPVDKKKVIGKNKQSGSGPKVHINNAPNGIIIDGGTVTNPTVNNFGPPPLPTPTVTVCVSQTVESDSRKNLTTIEMATDQKLIEPWYAFIFDGPVGDGHLGIDRHTVTYTHGKAGGLPNPENTLVLSLKSVEWGSGEWRPDQKMKVTVPSEKPVHLVNVLGGIGHEGLTEKFIYHCD